MMGGGGVTEQWGVTGDKGLVDGGQKALGGVTAGGWGHGELDGDKGGLVADEGTRRL